MRAPTRTRRRPWSRNWSSNSMEDSDAHPAMIRAAMAHLNLVMVHPFKDGNGRMARALQTLVLARERILAPRLQYRGVPRP